MLWELGKQGLRQSPVATLRMLRWLRAFRTVREELRGLGQAREPLDRIQFELPASRLAVPAEALETLVREWMWTRPLPFLRAALYSDVLPVLEALRAKGIPMGVFSDYPVREKLVALGLDRFFRVQVSAVDPQINAFKPHPRGFLYASEQLGVEPGQVLFVGDRMDVDGEGARAAGQDFRILDRLGKSSHTLRDYGQLARSWNV